jgi:hypothetical protein
MVLVPALFATAPTRLEHSLPVVGLAPTWVITSAIAVVSTSSVAVWNADRAA